VAAGGGSARSALQFTLVASRSRYATRARLRSQSLRERGALVDKKAKRRQKSATLSLGSETLFGAVEPASSSIKRMWPNRETSGNLPLFGRIRYSSRICRSTLDYAPCQIIVSRTERLRSPAAHPISRFRSPWRFARSFTRSDRRSPRRGLQFARASEPLVGATFASVPGGRRVGTDATRRRVPTTALSSVAR
jgi:hypothetical protein